MIKKSGSWFSYKDERIGQGREKASQFLKDNPDVLEEITQTVLDMNRKHLQPVADDDDIEEDTEAFDDETDLDEDLLNLDDL